MQSTFSSVYRFYSGDIRRDAGSYDLLTDRNPAANESP
jgi:hypothetical protein